MIALAASLVLILFSCAAAVSAAWFARKEIGRADAARDQIADAWKALAIERQKMHQRLDEANRRHYDDAMDILKDVARNASTSHIDAVRSLSTPQSIASLAEVNSSAAAQARVSAAAEQAAEHLHDALQSVSYGVMPLPAPEENEPIPAVPVPAMNGMRR
jgi:hypothetical protein